MDGSRPDPTEDDDDDALRRKRHRKMCGIKGCPKSAQWPTNKCTAHGGGKRCRYSGCDKGARSRSDFCKKHGGGKRCAISGCPKSARCPSSLCVRHGGGQKCATSGCGRNAVGVGQMCKEHADPEDLIEQPERLDGFQDAEFGAADDGYRRTNSGVADPVNAMPGHPVMLPVASEHRGLSEYQQHHHHQPQHRHWFPEQGFMPSAVPSWPYAHVPAASALPVYQQAATGFPPYFSQQSIPMHSMNNMRYTNAGYMVERPQLLPHHVQQLHQTYHHPPGMNSTEAGPMPYGMPFAGMGVAGSERPTTPPLPIHGPEVRRQPAQMKAAPLTDLLSERAKRGLHNPQNSCQQFTTQETATDITHGNIRPSRKAAMTPRLASISARLGASLDNPSQSCRLILDTQGAPSSTMTCGQLKASC